MGVVWADGLMRLRELATSSFSRLDFHFSDQVVLPLLLGEAVFDSAEPACPGSSGEAGGATLVTSSTHSAGLASTSHLGAPLLSKYETRAEASGPMSPKYIVSPPSLRSNTRSNMRKSCDDGWCMVHRTAWPLSASFLRRTHIDQAVWLSRPDVGSSVLQVLTRASVSRESTNLRESKERKKEKKKRKKEAGGFQDGPRNKRSSGLATSSTPIVSRFRCSMLSPNIIDSTLVRERMESYFLQPRQNSLTIPWDPHNSIGE